jgi:hypothetical protein
MSQDPGPFDYTTEEVDPGPGMAVSFVVCFFADVAIAFFLATTADSKLMIYFFLVVSLAANGIAIWWASVTKRERCTKGVIICTALMVLLDSACVGLWR